MSNGMTRATVAPIVNESLPSDIRSDYRVSWQHFPSSVQCFLTWISGKPISGQTAKSGSPFIYLFKVLGLLAAGVFASSIALKAGGLGLVLLSCGWISTVSAARQLQVVVVHHCAHRNFSRNRIVDKWLGRIVSAGLMLRDFDIYEQSHLQHHRNPLDAEDETVKFLRHLAGIEPGRSREELWRRLRTSLISPKFHFQFFAARLVSSLGAASLSHRVSSWFFLMLVLVLVAISNTWQVFWLTWGFPLTVLYQISTLLRLCSEHLWVPLEQGTKRSKNYYSEATVGIFLGDPLPQSGQSKCSNCWQWVWWWIRLLFLHLPTRVFVLVGETSCHDYHHRHSGVDNWIDAIFARQQDIDAGHPHFSKPYREVFGLFTAIDLAFVLLSQHPALEAVSTQNTVRTVYMTAED